MYTMVPEYILKCFKNEKWNTFFTKGKNASERMSGESHC